MAHTKVYAETFAANYTPFGEWYHSEADAIEAFARLYCGTDSDQLALSLTDQGDSGERVYAICTRTTDRHGWPVVHIEPV
jgi:hypothetical protein